MNKSEISPSSAEPTQTRKPSSESEEMLRLIVENVEDFAIFAIALDGNVVSWNPGVEKLLGYKESDFLGLDGCRLFTPEDNAQNICEMEKGLAREKGRSEDRRWHLRQDGSRFWANGLMMPLFDVAGALRGYAKIMRDETVHKQTEVEKEQLLVCAHQQREQAEKANRAKDQWLATISHELRTPLTSILGWANVLATSELDSDTARLAVETIERNAQAQERLINDLLDVSSIDNGRLRLDIQKVDLAELIQTTMDVVKHAAEAKEIELHVSLDPKAGLIMGDADRLRQVLWNLLTNAIKFTSHGQVKIALKNADFNILIIVSDSGQGIDPEFTPLVFERFQQAKKGNTRHQGGLGLGLSIAQDLVELHGGKIEVASPGLGQGTTFTVTLPSGR